MNSHVHNQRRSLREGFSTLIALIGFLPSVNVLMLYEVLFLAKSCSTLTAFKGLLTNMNFLMLSKV